MIQSTQSRASRKPGAVPIGRPALTALVAIALVCLLSGALCAQQQPSSEDERLAELIKKIEDGMRTIDENLNEVGAARVEKDKTVPAILNETRRRHQQVIRDLEELIQSIKYSP